MAKPRTEAIRPASWNKARLRQILKQSFGKKILVVGDVGVDRYTIGVVERISPEAPVPIVKVESEQLKLGLAANVADNIKALGGIPLLVGIVGNDRGAQDFKKLLKNSGIAPSHLLVDRARRTVLKERVVSDRQQLLRVDYESDDKLAKETQNQVLRRVRALLPKVDAVILEDYAKGLLDERLVASIVSMGKRAGKIVAMDPNSKSSVKLYRGASVLTPNTKEAEALSGIAIVDEESLKRAGQSLLKAAHAKYLVITRGKEGMAIFSAGNPTVRLIPTYAREVYDVSGAGDTVISVLTLALVAGASIEEASILGNLAAGVEVGKRGTATVSPQEVQTALDFFGTVGI